MVFGIFIFIFALIFALAVCILSMYFRLSEAVGILTARLHALEKGGRS